MNEAAQVIEQTEQQAARLIQAAHDRGRWEGYETVRAALAEFDSAPVWTPGIVALYAVAALLYGTVLWKALKVWEVIP